MADPAIVACPITGTGWTKVATAVTSATIHKKITTSNYSHTYMLTGGSAPTDLTDAIGWSEDTLKYIHSAAIDIYIHAANKAGSVRVDA